LHVLALHAVLIFCLLPESKLARYSHPRQPTLECGGEVICPVSLPPLYDPAH
jgi:hypothetical protein